MKQGLKKAALLLFLFVFVVPSTKANDYPISAISDSIKKNANAVVRFEKAVLELKGKNHATYTEDKVITILNPEADNLAVVVLQYGDQQSTTSFKAWIMDETGKTVAQFDKRDAKDYAANFDETINDERMKVWMLNTQKPPYTVHYTYQCDFQSTYFLPVWQPARHEKIGIEQASFHLITENENANFLASNVSANITGTSVRIWEVKNYVPIIEDEYTPDLTEILPRVAVMAKEFDLYQVHGSSKTWNDLGIFMSKLISDRDVLDGVTDPEAEIIIKTGGDKRTVVNRLYRYLQNNYRYVSIQLGIGGWRPQLASATMKSKFGDCKALVILMKALLKKAGIESFYTLVNTNDSRIELTTAFPHSSFNHAILCVPIQDDSIWLECTSQHDPAGYLGSFTEKRTALLIHKNGANIVHTPAYTEKANRLTSYSTLKWNEDNTVSVSGTVTVEGELQESLRAAVENKEPKQIESSILRSFKIQNSKLNSFQVTQLDSSLPRMVVKLELNNQGIIKKTSNRLFIQSNIYKPFLYLPEKNSTRLQKVVVKKGFIKNDTLIYNLPEGYYPENFNLSDSLTTVSPFGSASSIIDYNTAKNTLIVYQQFCLKEDNYLADQFSLFRDFLLKATKTYCPELVLKKRE